MSHMAAGAAAGGLATLINYPQGLSRLSKILLMTNNGENSGLTNDRISRFYRMFSISTVGVMIYSSVYFGGYETAKKVIFPQWEEKNFVGKYLVALGVTCLAVLASNPVDTVRRGMILNSDNFKSEYALDCARKIYNEEGLKAFVKGNRLNWVYGIRTALNLVLYDKLQRRLFQKNAGI